MRIDNEDLWKEIKSGSLRGLSIEGYFCNRMEKMSETTPTDRDNFSKVLSRGHFEDYFHQTLVIYMHTHIHTPAAAHTHIPPVHSKPAKTHAAITHA